MLSKTQNSLGVCKYKKLWFALSASIVCFSLILIITSIFRFGAPLRLGLDFIGGSQIVYKLQSTQESTQKSTDLKKTLKETQALFREASPVKDFRIQLSQVEKKKTLLILRTKIFQESHREKFEALLKKKYGTFELISVDTVSPTIGPELLRAGLISILLTLVGILLFVSSRFKKEFAFAGILALVHDLVSVVGLFSLLGLLFGLEVNTLFLTACLTVLGFSIHDTIVIFDRIRENLKYLSKKNSFEKIIELSISQIWFRSLCTSLTTLFVLLSLLFFGGESTKIFAGAMFAGILVGTYSSIFLASNLLSFFQSSQQVKKNKKS